MNIDKEQVANRPLVKLSIITPVYNASNFIESYLRTLQQQRYKDWEVVLLNNFSKDNTAEIIQAVAASDKRILLITESDHGIYDAMNKGIAVASGEWLCFLGADDSFYDVSVIENIFHENLNDVDILYGDVCWMPSGYVENGEWTPEIFINRNINHQRLFYRKTVFDVIGLYNPKYKVAADHELNIRAFCNNELKKVYFPMIVSKYNSEGFSAHKTDEFFWKDWDKIVLKNFRKLLPRKVIYGSLGTYCRYLIDKKRHLSAAGIVMKVFVNTLSFGFVILMMRYWLRSLKQDAA